MQRGYESSAAKPMEPRSLVSIQIRVLPLASVLHTASYATLTSHFFPAHAPQGARLAPGAEPRYPIVRGAQGEEDDLGADVHAEVVVVSGGGAS